MLVCAALSWGPEVVFSSYLGSAVTVLDNQILIKLQLFLSALKLEHLESRKQLGLWQVLMRK